jgi:hypothetical protein
MAIIINTHCFCKHHQFCWLKLTERTLKMFRHKNALIAVAVAVLLAACGGGGSDSSPEAGVNPGTNTGGTNNPPPGQTVADVKLAGNLILDQVVANGTPYPIESFEGTTPNNQGFYGQDLGVSGSPLKTFGLKMMPDQVPTTGGSGNGHIAIEIMDAAANSPQQFQVSIDRVDYKFSSDGNRTLTASAAKTAKAYLHVRNATGGVADVVVDNLPDGVITVRSDFADDAGFRGLIVDMDKLFAAAKTKAAGDAAKTTVLNTVKDFKGEFNMNATFSALNILRGANPSAGADITVAGSGQPAIKGTGVKGKLWINDQPPM